MTSILQFSDIHFGVEDREALAAVREFSVGLKPDLILICGDITQSGNVSEFEDAAEWIKSFPGPKLICPGNHDTPMFNVPIRIFNPFGRYNKYIQPLSEPFYANKHIIIVPMNTARGVQAKLDWSLGVVDMDVLEQKIAQLNAATPGTLKMIAVHHPLIYPANAPLSRTTKNGPEAAQRLSDANIDGVLSGHVHAPFVIDRQPGKTQFEAIGSGTLSTRSRGKPASFNHILVTESDIAVSAVDWIEDEYVVQPPWTRKRAALSPKKDKVGS